MTRLRFTLLFAAVTAAVLGTAARGSGQTTEPAPNVADLAEPSRINVNVFADVNVVRDGHGGTSLALGQIDLFTTATLADRWQFLGELVGEGNDSNEFGFELERLVVQYLAPGGARVAFGRYHTTIGYYNNTYHHGLWFQTAASRPRMFAFEDHGGLLPVHQVGISADGPLPVPGAGLRWTVELGNGQSAPGTEPVQTIRDLDRGKSLNVALTSRPFALRGAQVGVSLYNDWFTVAPSLDARSTILALHAVFIREPYEWLSEYARISNRAVGTQGEATRTWYVQAARRIQRVSPFVRYESITGGQGDVLLHDLGRLYGPSVGLRADVSPSVAIKAQYGHVSENGRPLHTAIGQVAFVF